MVAHHATNMPGMEDPTERLGEGIRWVDDSRDVVHVDVAVSLPVLDSEELNVDVTRSISRDVVVDHLDRGHVVFVDRSGSTLGKTEVSKDGPEVPCLLGGSNGSEKLSFSGASGSLRLSLGAVGNGAASQ